MKQISVVIPVYNNADSLGLLYHGLVKAIKAYNNEFDYEFVFVNDGSVDNSLVLIKELQEHDERIVIVNFSRNFGQMPAILAGWKQAKGDAVINISADLQDPPEQITKMLFEWENGSEIVVNYREARNDDFTAAFTSRVAYHLFRYSLPLMPKGGFDFSLLGRKAMDAINAMPERNRFYQGDILWVGFSIKFLPYTRQKRIHGSSGWNFSKRFGYFLNSFINISYFPIRLMSLIGFITATCGFIFAISILYDYFFHKTPFQGWAPIMMTILILGGMIMTMLGVIGEYIWRIFDEVKNKPNYIIKDIFKIN